MRSEEKFRRLRRGLGEKRGSLPGWEWIVE